MTVLAAVPAHAGRKPSPVRHLSLEELLVWTYRDQATDRMSHRSLEGLEAAADGEERRGRSADGCAQMVAVGALGVRVDEFGGCWGASAEVHPDADLVHEAVLSLGLVDARLLIDHARRGDRPERCTATPRPVPTEADSRAERYYVATVEGGREIRVKLCTAERVAVWVKRPGLAHRYAAPVLQTIDVEYSAISWEPDPHFVALVNAVHERWARALHRLDAALKGAAFKQHVVSGIFATGDDVAEAAAAAAA
jgi:hypothetical protein